ncbi:MAG TPA: hypothetical protein VFK10_12540 [Burkholderiaceae bacterium]|nr:hypothetical protein [Burkholderiaceae bacterium]
MDAFIGWSGQRGKKIAIALQAWLRAGIPELRCFISPELPKGRDWFQELAARLKESQLGLMCLAPPNVAGEWQLIEAGAIWKAARKGGLFPLHFGVGEAEVPAPLREFQATHFERADFLRLAEGVVRQALGAGAWSDARAASFDTAWAELQKQVNDALQGPDPSVHTPRGFAYEVAGGWWERLTATGDDTKLSWMRVARLADGTKLAIDGHGYDDEGQFASDWHTEFVAIDEITETNARVRYYWEGRHRRGSSALFGGVARLTFIIDDDDRVRRGSGEFTDVCLSAPGAPTTKLVDLRRASPEEAALMNGTDPTARRDLLRKTVALWT